jgi:hypothetical protein
LIGVAARDAATDAAFPLSSAKPVAACAAASAPTFSATMRCASAAARGPPMASRIIRIATTLCTSSVKRVASIQ